MRHYDTGKQSVTPPGPIRWGIQVAAGALATVPGRGSTLSDPTEQVVHDAFRARCSACSAFGGSERYGDVGKRVHLSFSVAGRLIRSKLSQTVPFCLVPIWRVGHLAGN